MTMGSWSIPSPLGCRGMSRAAALAAVLPLAACSNAGVLDPRGPIAAAERLLLVNSTAIMLVVVVPVILATLGFAWWYRASNPRALRSLELAYEGRIEFDIWDFAMTNRVADLLVEMLQSAGEDLLPDNAAGQRPRRLGNARREHPLRQASIAVRRSPIGQPCSPT